MSLEVIKLLIIYLLVFACLIRPQQDVDEARSLIPFWYSYDDLPGNQYISDHYLLAYASDVVINSISHAAL